MPKHPHLFAALRTAGEATSIAGIVGGIVMLWLDPAGSGGIVAFCGFAALLYLRLLIARREL